MRANPISAAAALAWIAVAALSLASGCSSAPNGQPVSPSALPPSVAAPAAPPAAATVPSVPQLTVAERRFASTVVANGLYQVEASKIAVSRASNAQVKAYAQMLVDQHGQANQQLMVMMQSKGMVMPRELAADKLTKLHRLEGLTPTNFDQGYVHAVGIDEHLADIARLERAEHEVNDGDLKAWIVKNLPVLRSHLLAAQNMAGASGK